MTIQGPIYSHLLSDPKVASSSLGRSVLDARSPQMQEIAALSVVKGRNQQYFAKRLSKPARNISRFFEAEKPRLDTIKAFGRALGLDETYILLMYAQELNDDELENAEHAIQTSIVKHVHFFEPKTSLQNRAFLNACIESRRRIILFEYVIGKFRLEAKIAVTPRDWPRALPADLGTYADLALPDFDLRKKLRKRVLSHESAFYELYAWCMKQDLDHQSIEEILEITRVSMMHRDVSYEQLDVYLHSEIDYITGRFYAKTLTKAAKKRNRSR